MHTARPPASDRPPARPRPGVRSAILDARESRTLAGGPTFTLSNRVQRAAWGVAWVLLAAWTPKPLRPWRTALLRLFGARMGRKADVRASARVWYPPHLTMGDGAILAARVNCYNMAPITVGRDALVSQGAHLCGGTHNIDDQHFQLVAKPITLGDRSWVAAEAFVGPGVTVGEGAVLGARSVAFRDLEDWTVYSGDPARPLRQRRQTAAHGGHDIG